MLSRPGKPLEDEIVRPVSMRDTDAEIDEMDLDFLPSPGWQLEQRAFEPAGITGAS
jgi:hypothetical protein